MLTSTSGSSMTRIEISFQLLRLAAWKKPDFPVRRLSGRVKVAGDISDSFSSPTMISGEHLGEIGDASNGISSLDRASGVVMLTFEGFRKKPSWW